MTPHQSMCELSSALRQLHRQAGEPSYRTLGKATHYSHTTVGEALKCSRLPTWTVLSAIVHCLGGDLDRFRALWVAVRDSEDPLPLGEKAPSSYVAPRGDDVAETITGEATRSTLDGGVQRSVQRPQAVLRWSITTSTRSDTFEVYSEQLALQLIWHHLNQENHHPGARDA